MLWNHYGGRLRAVGFKRARRRVQGDWATQGRRISRRSSVENKDIEARRKHGDRRGATTKRRRLARRRRKPEDEDTKTRRRIRKATGCEDRGQDGKASVAERNEGNSPCDNTEGQSDIIEGDISSSSHF